MAAMTVTTATHDAAFPCSLTISVPLPTARLASAAHAALRVDEELSALVRREFDIDSDAAGAATILRTTYRATTNRMLRVAVNGFMESLLVVLGVMEELDADVIAAAQEGANGVEIDALEGLAS